jgi:beta-lactam-binding protein with PASTA domain
VGVGHRIGELFDGRYRLEQRIGAGGMADVYLAHDETLDRRVAIKLLADRYTQDAGFIERFRREATAAAGLTDANIVGIYDRGEADGQYYIAMEYVDGRTLKDEINAHAPLPEPEAINYAQQALKALEVAHSRGVVHRDVKPHNMMINGSGVLKMTDFGIARAATHTEMTEVGSIVGTAQYLSPEQARGQSVGPRSDLYSMGVVLYEMLTGQLPYTGGSAVEIAMKHVNDQPVPPSELNRLVSPAMEQVVLRALAKDPELRYRSAREMADELERVRRGLGVSQDTQQATRVLAAPTQVMEAYTPPTRTPPPPAETKRSWVPWFLVVLLLLAAAGAGYLIYQELQGEDTVEIANVDGLTCEQAQRLLEPTFETKCEQRESEVDQIGTVIGTDPEGSAPKGSLVTLFIGSGPKAIELPDVTGQTFDQAFAQLQQLGFTNVTRKDVNSPKGRAGEVVAMSPKPGQEYKPDRAIVLSVASGSIAVPNVVGRTQADAEQAIRNAKLTVGTVTTQSSDTTPEGSVISSNPSAGIPVPRGTVVNLIVSSGPAQVEVLNVIGLSEADATAAITGQGLEAKSQKETVCDATQEGLVVDQDPAPNTPVDPGTRVTILVCDPPGP